MKDYFEGVFNHLIERGKQLLAKIPPGSPIEFQALEKTCRDQLKHIISRLESITKSDVIQNPQAYPVLLRQLRNSKAELDFHETVGIAALNRADHDTDVYLNRLVGHIRQEIRYPLNSPVISALSQDYFYIYSDLGLLCVPLGEAEFMLHLPDLYHELAHPLLNEEYDPRVQRFRQNFVASVEYALNYLAQELEKEDRARNPESYSYYLRQWMKYWHSWTIEFFCDLFAIYTIGPAFAWANIHLCAVTGGYLYAVPIKGEHPTNDARMRAMLFGLELISHTQAAQKIRQRWDELTSVAEERADPEYYRCYPDHILKLIAEKALEGVLEMGCRIAKPDTDSPIHNILNETWAEFWQDPKGFSNWERNAVKKLKRFSLMMVT